jgi:hypothetical protein
LNISGARLGTALVRCARWLSLVIAVAVSPSVAAADSDQAAPRAIDADVKAVFLLNFSKFVGWPAVNDGDRPRTDLRICVTANDEFYGRLKASLNGEQVDGRPLVPVTLEGLDDAKTCHILYVGDVQSADAKAWLSAVRGRQVLTVADGSLNDDTVIAFVRDGGRIRFDINRASALRRNLTVSAKLLHLARRVKDR